VRPRRRILLPLVSLVVLVGAIAFAAPTTTTRHVVPPATIPYGAQGHPTPAVAMATTAATAAYRLLLGTAGQQLANAVRQLQRDTSAGDLHRARSDWINAQMAYDVLRGPIAGNSSAALEFDGRVGELPPVLGRTGLHVLEEDLFGGTGHLLSNDATNAGQMALILEFSLQRTPATPTAMLTNAERQMSWALTNAVSQREEVYSHLDLIDVAATVDAVRQILQAVKPLAGLVVAASSDWSIADARLRVVTNTLVALGPPATRPDSTVAPATWRTLGCAMTAVLEPLTALGGDLFGYGTGRTYA
jgi:hypothetical protein